jgi:uncharacterized protein (TIGR02453 family)
MKGEVMKVNLKPTLEFLGKLRDNNNRMWFQENRTAFDQAQEAFAIFIDALIRDLGKFENMAGVSAKDCIFRIYRDIRFSKDKTPYKTNMGAEIVGGGRRSGRLGLYFHIAPHDQSMIAGGLYMPSGEQITKFRQTIARDARKFKKIVNEKEFKKYFGKLEGEKLKTAPQGFARDHPEIELLKLKQVLVHHPLSDKQVLAPNVEAHVVGVCKAMKPFLDYLNDILK